MAKCTQVTERPAEQSPARHWAWRVVLLIIVLLAVGVRWRLLDVPLQRGRFY